MTNIRWVPVWEVHRFKGVRPVPGALSGEGELGSTWDENSRFYFAHIWDKTELDNCPTHLTLVFITWNSVSQCMVYIKLGNVKEHNREICQGWISIANVLLRNLKTSFKLSYFETDFQQQIQWAQKIPNNTCWGQLPQSTSHRLCRLGTHWPESCCSGR